MEPTSGGSLRIDWFDGSVHERPVQPAPSPPPAPAAETPADAGRLERKLMGFRRLAELAESDPGAVTLVLSGRTSFWDLLETELKPDFIVLISKVLVRLCEGSPTLTRPLLLRALDSRYLATLSDYLLSLPATRISEKRFNMQFWSDADSAIENVVRLCRASCTLRPHIASSLLAAVRAAAAGLMEEHLETFSEETYRLMDEVEGELERVGDTMPSPLSAPAPEPTGRPFRGMSVLPTLEDLAPAEGSRAEGIRVEGSRAVGAYDDVEHYLDVQFRLLREDYIAPLREGIRDYLQDPSKSQHENIRVHAGVNFLRPHVAAGRVGYLVRMRPAPAAPAAPSASGRRFMFGALLLFTRDNFRTMLCATVLDSSSALLSSGYLVVSLHCAAPPDVCRHQFLMLESEVYLEPYRRVLQALQETRADQLPMSDYIVHVKTDIKPPRYLTNETKYIISKAGDEIVIPVLDVNNWPGHEDLELDESQYDAYKLALTKEFALIQGPPGTGKSFIGLQICRTLLSNLSLAGTPLLVLSYTNHALDQFLENILKITTDVVRLGSQNKSVLMEPYTLNNLRARCRSKHSYVYNSKVKQQEDIVKRMIELQTKIERCEGEILSYKVVKPFLKIGGRLYNLDFCNSKEDPLIEWLFAHVQSKNPSHSDQKCKNQMSNDEENNTKVDETSEEIPANWDDDEDSNSEPHNIDSCFSEAWALKEIERMQESSRHLRHLTSNPRQLDELAGKFRESIEDLRRKLECLKSYLSRDRSELCRHLPRRPTSSLKDLPARERWALYSSAAEKVRESLLADMSRLEGEHTTRSAELDRLGCLLDAELARSARVLGATTTAAARRRDLLAALRSPLVIVEEAAEVLEAHIVAALTPHCQHLILIGDHQQLRPTSADYHLSRTHNLTVSLPERMSGNGVPGRRLAVQRRMRPSLLALICPHVYPALASHESVAALPRIRGVDGDLYFLTHGRGEQCGEDGRSYRNVWEAQWMVALASHLRRQDYEPGDIVLLTAYTGQAQLITEMCKDQPLLEDVRVAVVDNFQGEESRIVLLSLVRSNSDGDVGFLATDNRVCVALSRAKEGMYMFGDMSALRTRSALWRRVEEVLQRERAIGENITLRCVNHPQNVIQVAHPDEIAERSPRGGCRAACGAALACGHRCAALCHAYDADHRVFTCAQPCERRCPSGHACPLRCGEPCGACGERAAATLPCGHAARVACGAPAAPCAAAVAVTLPCRHQVEKACHQEFGKVRCMTCGARAKNKNKNLK